MLRKALIGVAAFVAIATVSFAQGKTDLSGTWKLNVDKSEFGPVPGPSTQTDVIEQNGPTVKVSVNAETEQGKLQYTMSFTTDGKEITISPDAPGAHPNPEVTLQTISASWQGATLDVNQKLTYGDEPVTGVSHYALSPDGKVLTITSDYQSQMGDATRVFVFEKQDPSAVAASAAPTPATTSTAGSATSTASGSMASASTSAKPNLSGTWVLDTKKSDFGPMPPPSSATNVIEHKEPSIKISVNQTNEMGEMAFTMDLLTDGKKVSTWQIFGNEAKSTAHWDGDTLVVSTDASIQDAAMKFVNRYTLSADGNTLNVQGHFSGPMGEGDTKVVYAKK